MASFQLAQPHSECEPTIVVGKKFAKMYASLLARDAHEYIQSR